MLQYRNATFSVNRASTVLERAGKPILTECQLDNQLITAAATEAVWIPAGGLPAD